MAMKTTLPAIRDWQDVVRHGKKDQISIGCTLTDVSSAVVVGGYVGVVVVRYYPADSGETCLVEHHIRFRFGEDYDDILVDSDRSGESDVVPVKTYWFRKWLGSAMTGGNFDAILFHQALLAYGTQRAHEIADLWR